MNGKEILVDTNIFLYLLNGNNTLEQVLDGKNIYLSFMTELELIGYKNITEKEEKQVINLINDCSIIQLNDQIKRKYVEIRKKYQLKLVDAIISATALSYNLPLITADKQFKTIKELNLVFYEA
jgi:predicted nucleic acid-binding protein